MERNKRKISPNEKMYLLFEKNYNSFAINRVVKGVGEIKIDELEKAIKNTAENFPESCYSLKGNYLVKSNEIPKVKVIDREVIGEKFENLLKRKIDLSEELACEVLYLKENDELTLIFRTHHAVMDGKGQGIWIESIFRELNGIQLEYSKSYTTDYELLKQSGKKKLSDIVTIDKYTPIEKRESFEITTPLSNLLVIENKIQNITAKLISAIQNLSVSEKSRFIITRDIRDKFPNEQWNAGNLSLPFYLMLDKKIGWEKINKEIVSGIINNRDLEYSQSEYTIFDKVPFFLLKFGLNRTIQKYNKKELSASTSVISNLGKLDIKNYSTNSFTAKDIYALPVITPLVPISFVITEVENRTYITAGYYKDNFTDETISNYLDRLKSEMLNEKPVYIFGDKKVNKIDIFTKIFSHQNSDRIISYSGGAEFKYRDIFKKANSFAHYLKSLGVNKGDKVAISTKRDENYLISILGVLKVGAIFIPIDPEYPQERKEYIKSVSNSKILIESITEEMLIESEEVLETNYNSDDVVYIIFTSGSTGKPKGVEITYRTLCNYISNCIEKYEINSNVIFGFFTSISFDLSITAIFTSLTVGGALEFFEEKVTATTLEKMFKNSKMNAVKITPTHLEIISNYAIEKDRFKFVIVGGEQLKLSVAKKAHSLLGEDCKIINEYGPTEATVGCVYHIYDKNQKYLSEGLPIGIPLDHIDLILNMNKDSGMGELLIGGDCLAKGYFENIVETDKKFIYVDGKRFYKSGDICRINSENQLEFLERKDFQVKIRGYRIELEEIERKIQEIEGINGVKVLANNSKTGLIAYYIGDVEKDKINSYLKERVPEYMLPYLYFSIDEFPLNSNGKLDTKLLKEKVAESENAEEKSDIIFNEMERKIISIWEEILEMKIPSNRVNESFYELGADSLSIVRFINEIEKMVNKEDIELIILEPTLKNILNYIESK